jgi:hypothetical protein
LKRVAIIIGFVLALVGGLVWGTVSATPNAQAAPPPSQLEVALVNGFELFVSAANPNPLGTVECPTGWLDVGGGWANFKTTDPAAIPVITESRSNAVLGPDVPRGWRIVAHYDGHNYSLSPFVNCARLS